MGNLKVSTAIIAALTLLLIMVLLRSFNENLFTRNVEDAVSIVQNKTISTQYLADFQHPYQVVNLDGDSTKFKNAWPIPLRDILLPENRKKLNTAENDLLLYSENPSTSAKAWVILNQLGIERIFIFSDDPSPEVLKYKFQPDTMIRLESN